MTTPMSTKQSTFIRSLLAERDGVPEADQIREDLNTVRETAPEALTTKFASGVIDRLLTLPRAAAAKAAELEDGMYQTADGTIFKVYHTVRGANQQVAKQLIAGSTGKWALEYIGKRPLHKLTAADRMSEEAAMEFGQIYGICCVCAAILTNEESIALGIGPICRNNF